LSAIAFSEPDPRALLRMRTLQAMNGSVFLSIRRPLSRPTWWPFQENLFGLHHLRRLVY
jgi:hypothetical protein